MEPPESPSAALQTPDEDQSSQTPPPPSPPLPSTTTHQCLPHSTTTTTTTATAALENPDEDESNQTPPPPSPPLPSNTTIHQCVPHSTTTTTAKCFNCGGPAEIPPPQPVWSEISPPPNYRPIRAPALNLPPNYSQQAIIDTPVPKSEKVSVISLPHKFKAPSKKIRVPDDMKSFIKSDSANNFIGFIVSLSESIRGKKLSEPCHESETLSSICSVMDSLVSLVDEIPPIQQAGRYGNFAYRDWYDRLLANSEDLMLKFLPEDLKSSTKELVPYFTDSFGNSARLDYGTGHETNFAAWLYCLARMGVIKEEDYQAVVCRVFIKYLSVTIQTVYDLEPAGSHGVWGLDDYHFLPFIFGSSQLIDHKYMKPKSIHNQDILDNFAKEYLYISCIAFVKEKKKGVFAEHSPLLDDISGVPNWGKVNGGLLKMYKAEIMESIPIMQHFLFGSLLE
ncbi:serine/threonine-protein phosphatase 2A activator-like isoform X2 [Papaver somniferum]|nr:serine/threonine-protein phosphatase 2A activator-like isoform X2 [Papaver somniferum]